MESHIPHKLSKGDEIRVIAPSCSLGIIGKTERQTARIFFESLGLQVSLSAHVEEMDHFTSSSIASRLADLHDAFQDTHVKGIKTPDDFICSR
ncbi:MAG: hypothetical protein COT25_05085 [Candidatus Kerfeldbacteria bacterium CG08_land_8_20_14_0_20_42_7]|uniref:LD-carboxypeptidase N-terminal domain-containing protein n=1 Tax=Candidatus Kerfeldbacteria bacterium CG08_land_8_20_14_0_20_42_7 TaxID=2014245 RepID=A0A2H0YRD7_9BACT|nr:MAG: hypothetical protein COT25_05085 [Candidatus Kerfeldbacteria bacterium CG08_land_8_20_14_0_20_42_7]